MICKNLDNGMKLIYIKREGKLTSYCIGVNAGAIMEKENEYGMAHAVEHLIFKGTKKRNEYEINKSFDNLYAFNNAMTNFSYVIFYGTLLTSDFGSGLELYSDIVINPLFSLDGFKEEMNVIKEEYNEWMDDTYKNVEASLFKNAFQKRRIRELIIGNKDNIDSITMENVMKFYKRLYNPENSCITVATSLDFEETFKIVNENFDSWCPREEKQRDKLIYEGNISGIFVKENGAVNSCKIEYLFLLDSLNDLEKSAFELFNIYFGVGTGSILYDEIRTKRGLAYDVSTSCVLDTGLRYYTITLSTSEKNVNKSIEIINSKIESLKKNISMDDKTLRLLKNRMRLKMEFQKERGVEYCKRISEEYIMTGNVINDDEYLKYERVSSKDIRNVVAKVFLNPSIQILKNSR